jgi:hypothetical protein
VVTRLLPSALAIAALAGATAAPAAPAAWGPPHTVTSPTAQNIAATGNAKGEQLFAWRVTTKRRLRSGFASYVRARARLANGTLGATRIISSTREMVATPAVALDAAGNATVVWSQAGRQTRIMGAYRPRGDRFGTPFELGRTSAFLGARPSIAVTPGGAATVTWNGGAQVQVVRRAVARCRTRSASGCFTRPQYFSRGADQTVAMTAGGTAFIVYSSTARMGTEVRTQLRLAIAPGRDGLFGPTRTIPGPGQASQPSLALTADGSALIAWRGSPPTGGEQDVAGPILVSARDAMGRLVGPVVVSQFPGSRPQLRLNGRDEAILVWNQSNPTPANPDGQEVAVAVRGASGAFGGPLTLSAPGTAAGGASLAVDAAGTATVVYSAARLGAGYTTGPILPLVHRRAPGGAFGAPQQLPTGFPGAFVFAAGMRVTAVSAGFGGDRTAISDYVP